MSPSKIETRLHVDEPLDPTGCGDVFGAATVSYLLRGVSVEKALAEANALAAANLSFLGDKANYDYVVEWIKDPRALNPKTVMPSFRLTDAESRDIATYLGARSRRDGCARHWIPLPSPKRNWQQNTSTSMD